VAPALQKGEDVRMSGHRPGLAHLLAVVGLVAVCTGSATAQTPPPPTAAPTASDEHLDFSGTWSFDRSISTDPSQITFDPAGENRQTNNNRRAGFGGFGGPGGGGFGRGRNNPQGNRNGAVTLAPLEQERLKALTSQLKTASSTLVISHHDPSFVVNDAEDHTQFFQTNGAKDENHVGSTTLTSSTHWEGSRIVTEYDISSRLTLAYTYTLLPKTNQLVVRIARRSSDGQRQGEPEVRLVYTQATPRS